MGSESELAENEVEDLDLEPYSELLNEELSNENLEKILEMLIEENFAERGCLWMPTRDLVYIGDEVLRLQFPFSRSVIRNVLSRGRGLVSFDPSSDERLGTSQSIAAHNVRSCLCSAAHNADGEILAIAYFDNQASGGNFSEDDLHFLNKVMDLFPEAVSRAQDKA